MTATKKLIDGNGNQYFPQTHTKAVVDDNGYNVESRMQAVQDVVNQAQMDIGAVPSDLAPTENSTYWVTSGGVYNATTVGENAEISLSDYTAVRAFPSSTSGNWVCTNNSYPYYGYFVPITSGKSYRIVSGTNGARYAFLTNSSYSHGTTVSYATDSTRIDMENGSSVVAVAPSDAKYLYVSQQWDSDRSPQKIEELGKTTIKDVLTDIDTEPVQNSEKLINSGGVFDATTLIKENSVDLSQYSESKAYILTTGWKDVGNTASRCKFIPIINANKVRITTSTAGTFYAFLKTITPRTAGTTPDYATGETGRHSVASNTNIEEDIPSDAAYLYVATHSEDYDITPQDVTFVLQNTLVDVVDDMLDYDDIPTANSEKAAKSGGIYDAINDVSERIDELKDSTLGSLETYTVDMSSAWKNGAVNTTTGEIVSSSSNAYCYLVKVNDLVKISTSNNVFIKGVFAYSTSVGSSFLKKLYYGYSDDAWDTTVTELTFNVHAKYIRVQVGKVGGGSITPEEALQNVTIQRLNYVVERTISPQMDYEWIGTTTGDFSTNASDTSKVMSTLRYIKTPKDAKIVTETDCYVSIFYYDSDFTFLEQKGVDVIANIPIDIARRSDYSYIKVGIWSDSNYETKVPRQQIKLIGNFDVDWDTFNPRSTDSGYHRIRVNVNVTNPTCCDTVTSSVQDSEDIRADYGVICLPTQYSPTGEATRLIIYCHGAAVNYSSSVTRFNTQDLEPEYWLGEGYAVMDVEGNPFDNTNEHQQMPQAMDSYVAAYKWAIAHYNLKRDGIFLGGRSMGGSTVFNLMRRQCPIPVIAACPNVPSTSARGRTSAERKTFFATHCGFVVPDGFTWSDGTYTSAEKEVYLANWDKLIKCTPIMGMVTDLPTTAAFKQSFIDCFYNESNDRVAMWSSLHAMARCPVKIFGCNQDTTCNPQYGANVYYRMFLNAGQIVELRLFDSFKDYTGTGTSAHHYDTQDPALRTTVTTRYGVEMTNVPVVYVEMLQFWRRYEQGY